MGLSDFSGFVAKEMNMSSQQSSVDIDLDSISRAADRAARAIPPAWPLSSSVAVNPFIGQSGESLATAGARLARVAGARVVMPRTWFLDKIEAGVIADVDLEGARVRARAELRPQSLADLKAVARLPRPEAHPLPTIADLAANASGVDWSRLIDERFGAWAAGYFDAGQALWSAPRGRGPYAAWRAVATHDLTPEIAGLAGFASFVFEAPESIAGVLARATRRLGLRPEALETYFHQLLMTLGGWAQYARYKLWQAELAGASDATITDFLAIRLLWEEALFERHGAQIGADWRKVLAQHAHPVTPSADDVVDEILQEASERSAQRALATKLAAPSRRASVQKPWLQAAFCIDVRSEVFRRALETVDPGIQTLGFAGFFGLAVSHRRFASDARELRAPVLIHPSVMSCSGDPANANADLSARVAARALRAWGRFKLAAVSSFAFVEGTGPIYAAKLLRDALGWHAANVPNDPAPRVEPAQDLATRIQSAETVLRAMSLTEDFARVVLITGHGANVVNNPQASALNCGACGGYSGEVNARLLASLLNDPEVRDGLMAKGVAIPGETLFLAALHDTTTDKVTLYAKDQDSSSHKSEIKRVAAALAAAGKLARGERAPRLPRAAGQGSLVSRSRDWAEIRPEWALAGCKAFIAAPRERTSGLILEGGVFLHDYDWRRDRGFRVLELILTAPVVVASWISLQYYGSTVAPKVFGGGNKLLHNVVGGIGVIEGNAGALRAGLPWQSVHDGERYVHEPLRLSVGVEAPREAITDILARHEGPRSLFDNRWLHLFALDDQGKMAWRYAGDLQWAAMGEDEAAAAPPRLKATV
jgi:hypothetical protein